MIETVEKLAQLIAKLPAKSSICFTDGRIGTGRVYELSHAIDCIHDDGVIFIIKEVDNGTMGNSSPNDV